ncbi:MAG: molybdate ABC transporter permease subunit [Bacillota bacterium]|nr:molybdate ABC transporter permease subunit [Bacillota bacterium]
MDTAPFIISLKTAIVSTFLTFFLGIYAAKFVVNLKRGKGLLDAIFTLPMVLPPTVTGFFLLLVFGNNSFIGKFLNLIGRPVVFSWEGTVVASTVVAFPLMYRTARGAFDQMDHNIIFAARTLGLKEHHIFYNIILPNCWPGIIAGTILSFARALGEFGATIMIAGNIPNKTQTISIAVYTAVQAGDYDLAYKWVIVIVLISFVSIAAMNMWNTKQSNIISNKGGI